MPRPESPPGTDDLVAAHAAATWGQLVAAGTALLREAGLERPAVDARRIVEEASGCDGAELAAALDQHPATDRNRRSWAAMVLRRTGGEPLQYVLGRWAFRHLDLFVDQRVLIPRPETEQVVEVAIREGRALGDHLTWVDLGTGSGAIALSIAREVDDATVWATDVSAGAISVARANLAALGRRAQRVRIVEGSWYEALPSELVGAVDVVVSNPPYVREGDPLPPVVADWEPMSALRAGDDGLSDIDEIVAGAAIWLRPGGVIVMEHAPDQGHDVRHRAEAVGLVDAATRADLAGRARMLVARRSTNMVP